AAGSRGLRIELRRRREARLQAARVGYREREAEFDRAPANAVLRLALVGADGRRRRDFMGVLAEDRPHAPAARDAPHRDAAAMIDDGGGAVSLQDGVGTSLRDAGRDLRAVAAD